MSLTGATEGASGSSGGVNPDAVVTLTHVTCGYRGAPVLKDVSLTLEAGFHIVMGPNGAGKTTLFRVIGGVILPVTGTITLRDSGSIGYVMHRSALSTRLTVRQNLEYWAKFFGGGVAARVDEVMAYTALANQADKKASDISRGQAQRLAVARALLAKPEVLLLDEPLSGVDPSGTEKLLTLFQALGEAGTCVIVSTHQLAELNQMPGQVIALRDGQVIGQGSARDLMRTTVTAQSVRWRIRGGAGLADAITALGVAATPVDDAVEVSLTGDEAVAALNKGLVERGVSVFELAPVVDELTRLYRSLEKEGS